MIVTAISPSVKPSSTPVAVIVCGVSQFPLLNVRVAKSNVISPVSPLVTFTTTSVAGCLFKTTVKVAVVPVSLVLFETAPKVIPGGVAPVVNDVGEIGQIKVPSEVSICQLAVFIIKGK